MNSNPGLDALCSVINEGGTKLVKVSVANPAAALGVIYQWVLDGLPESDIGIRLRSIVMLQARQEAANRS